MTQIRSTSFKYIFLGVFKKVYEVYFGNVEGNVIIRAVICS